VKLFEFETLEEGVAQVRNIKGIAVSISDHVFERMKIRTAFTPKVLDNILGRIPDVRNKFKPLEQNQSFKIWSKSLNMGIALRKGTDKEGHQRVLVVTVLDKPLFDNADDIVFYVG